MPALAGDGMFLNFSQKGISPSGQNFQKYLPLLGFPRWIALMQDLCHVEDNNC